jgi:hypothetical protein
MAAVEGLRITLQLLSVLVCPVVSTAAAQSVNAAIVGTVYDEQHGVLPGATIRLQNLDTGQVHSTTSGETGTFRVVGLAPGRHQMTVELVGFTTAVDTDIHLSLTDEIEINPTLKIAGFADTAVVGGQGLATPTEIALGRTITTKQIDELPVANRDFTGLALLTTGILENHSSGMASSSGVQAAALTGRSTSIVTDGLTLDDMNASGVRGSISVDAIQEFRVLSNGFNAEYGQSAGAVVSILTRAGTNQLTGRASYYHRDDAWDATPAQARLAVPPLSKSPLTQNLASGFLGGPVVTNRLFFFGSADETLRDTESIVTSPVLSRFRPDSPSHVPVHENKPQILGRGDANLSPSDSLTVRYRLSQNTLSPWLTGPTLAPERGVDNMDRNQDGAIMTNQVWGSRGLNEFRAQFARRTSSNDPTRYCAGCFAEERKGLSLGKGPAFPNSLDENRWQIADSVTWLRPGTLGDHALKMGVDGSDVGVQFVQLVNGDGTFTFDTNQPFDPGIPETYPTTYSWTLGKRVTQVHTKLLALFIQDEWKLHSEVTLNLGARWDYQDAPGLSQRGKVEPRLGIGWDPWRTGRTMLRGSYGLYYDQVFLRIARDADQATNTVQNVLAHPGYPLPFGFNPLRTSGPIIIQDTTRLANDLHTPYTAQATVGARREIGSDMAVSADVVWARGHSLFLTHDLNYPDVSAPGMPRPDPRFRQISDVESHGHSWYNALQVGMEKRHTHRYSFTAAYTLSSSERDTEDYMFIAQDPHNEAAERGPSSSDVRHRLAASVNVDLPCGLRVTAISTAQSALPYTITTGARNADGYLLVRPQDVGRNSARGTAFSQTDVRLSRAFRMRPRRLELIAEAFNVANRPNWIAYDGQQISPTYGRPTMAANSREVQLGVRVDF